MGAGQQLIEDHAERKYPTVAWRALAQHLGSGRCAQAASRRKQPGSQSSSIAATSGSTPEQATPNDIRRRPSWAREYVLVSNRDARSRDRGSSEAARQLPRPFDAAGTAPLSRRYEGSRLQAAPSMACATPSAVPMSWSARTLGWLIAIARASRSKRASASGSAASPRGRTLMATSRPSRASWARTPPPAAGANRRENLVRAKARANSRLWGHGQVIAPGSAVTGRPRWTRDVTGRLPGPVSLH